MTDQEISRFLWEKMGNCWHEWSNVCLDGNDKYPLLQIRQCILCRELTIAEYDVNPDLLSDAMFLPVVRWARDEKHEGWTWDDFMIDTCGKWECYKGCFGTLMGPDLIRKLAEFLEEK